ncbi:MAG: GIY-YIG nuclease family protein [Planctomycetes bacterium]|nr:GIY-YIG nuclease family protein [Planctomycetota bacterium]
MPVSELRLIKRCAELLEQTEQNISLIPQSTRGIYTLLKYQSKTGNYDVVYIGMAGGSGKGGIRSRLKTHRRRKGKLWSHFSMFEVWDNIREEEIRELEGIFRHIYRKDTGANRLNQQRSFNKLAKVRDDCLEKWTN